MGIKEFVKNIVKPRVNENPIKKKLPEEVELESYDRQEYRDYLRKLVQEKRKKHNQMFVYKPPYDHNEGVKNHFDTPKPIKQNYWNNKSPKQKSMFWVN